jgi:COP9 signalosome complex subunit 1
MAPTTESAAEMPKMDLDIYISNYEGQVRLERLIAIASAASPLSPDALRLAVLHSKKGLNADVYLRLVEELSKMAPNDPLALSDMDWATAVTKKAKAETDRLENELKAYKNNLIKESIRVSLNKLIYRLASNPLT